MSYKSIKLHCPKGKVRELKKLTAFDGVIESHVIKRGNSDNTHLSLIVQSEDIQPLLDRIQQILGKNPTSRAVITKIDALIPKPGSNAEELHSEKKKFMGVSREELTESIYKGIVLDRNFVALVIFSTIVAAIGLLEDNVAVVIGAMVIAPLLGPNIALAFSTSLGDSEMIKQAVKTNCVGLATCLVTSVIIGLLWPYSLDSHELQMRTDVSFDVVILAIVSGAAAVLSLTRGISSIMVGVMVAVALLPPATTLGIMLGSQQYPEAYGSFLLLLVNVVCVNLSAKLALLWQGIRPRTWYRQKIAASVVRWYLLFWIIALGLLLVVIYLKQ